MAFIMFDLAGRLFIGRQCLPHLADERFKKKYGMSFSAFEKKNLVKEKGFSWEVEKDAMEGSVWGHPLFPPLGLMLKVK